MSVTIHQIKLPFSNAFLVLGEQAILIDTGSPGDKIRILGAMKKLSVEPQQLSAIVLTHAHSDHAGSCVKLKAITKAPILMGAGEITRAANGQNGNLAPTSFGARLIKPFVDKKFLPFTADAIISAGDKLIEYGVELRMIETPGHTAGSLSFISPEGDAIIGDVLMGGYMGGTLFPQKPNTHYFVEDQTLNRQSLDCILASGANRLFVGHGGPLTRKNVMTWALS
jgi:hydroxyacylglutathione hydrolase